MKLKMYRNKKLTNSAKNEACVSCCANDGTIVWAHSNRYLHGKGRGQKAHDLFGAYLCHNCHKWFDGDNTHIPPSASGFNKFDWFILMWEHSMLIACEKNYL